MVKRIHVHRFIVKTKVVGSMVMIYYIERKQSSYIYSYLKLIFLRFIHAQQKTHLFCSTDRVEKVTALNVEVFISN